MIIFEHLGTTSGEPMLNMPSKDPEFYMLNLFSYGSNPNPLWCGAVESARGLTIGRDHFRTKEEAFEFVVSVINLLEIKYPNVVCSNFSFLNKE